jgi:DNA-binding CsgD family transcriptional regulator
MAQLHRRDFEGMLDFLAGLYGAKTLDAYVDHTIHGLRTLVPCDISVYNEVNSRSQRFRFVTDPVEANPPEAPQAFAAHGHEHPFLSYWNGASGNVSVHRVVTLSDFVGQRDWHNTGFYSEFYGPVIGMESIIAVRLPAPMPIEIYLTLLRSVRDFGDRDRLVLGLLRRHLVAAYQNAEALSEREHELAALHRGLEAAGCAVIVLGHDGRIRQMTEQGQNWLTGYFGPRWTDRSRPPSPLDGWVKRQEFGAARAGANTPVREPLVAERDGRRLTVRLMADGERPFLLLTEEKLRLEASDLAALGLARRETEVLVLLAAGKTNEAVAEALGLAPATVKHCVERIYAKLGVFTRAAAVAMAMRAAGRIN